MKKKLGNFFLIIGSVSLVIALVLLISVMRESRNAERSASNVLTQIHAMESGGATEEVQDIPSSTETWATDSTGETIPVSTEEIVVDIDGYGYIGYLTFPTLDLQLPVMSDWDYTRLKISPCRYVGTIATDDIVIAAHNNRHFGPINDLVLGDSVVFTDMNGVSTQYEVVESSILASTAIEEMTSGEFDLTLFTCTLGGQSRVTVRCNRAEAE